jgi:hypothetical protein
LTKKFLDKKYEFVCYEVLWAGARGVFGCSRKSYLKDWVKGQGEWAEIVSIKYKKNDKKLKVIK